MNGRPSESEVEVASGRPLRVAVLGTGRAGQARARDLAAAPDCELAAVVSARRDGDEGVRRVAGDPGIDAVIVATDNASHAAYAAVCLEAGKHVAVEFPLCATAREAEALHGLAARHGRVLHLELIGLLATPHLDFRAEMRGMPWVELTSRFQGGLYRWVQEELEAGHYGQLSVGRLHALWDLAGPLTLQTARLTRGPGRTHWEVVLAGAGGARVILDEARGEALTRSGELFGAFADGRTARRGPPVSEPLFMRDLQAFVTRIRSADRKGAYVSDQDVRSVVALAQDISAALGAA